MKAVQRKIFLGEPGLLSLKRGGGSRICPRTDSPGGGVFCFFSFFSFFFFLFRRFLSLQAQRFTDVSRTKLPLYRTKFPPISDKIPPYLGQNSPFFFGLH